MHFIRSTANSWFNLPRDGGVAYAAQEPWIQNETIRDNILFRSPYDEIRYRKGANPLLFVHSETQCMCSSVSSNLSVRFGTGLENL